MNAMTNPFAKTSRAPAGDDGRRLKRLEFEMALEFGDAGGMPFRETLEKAAATAGGEVLFVLPATGERSATGLIRTLEGGQSHFIQVRVGDGGFTVLQDDQIEADLLGFARASIDVLERLRADRNVIAPLASAAH